MWTATSSEPLPAEYTTWLNDRISQTGSLTMRKVPWTIGETNVLVGLHSQASDMHKRPNSLPTRTGECITRETRPVGVLSPRADKALL